MNNSTTALLRKRVFLFLVLFFITFIVHAFVLRFIFPGYYRPLAIQHEDHYTPAAFAFAVRPGYSFRLLMDWPRPVFMMFLKLIGYAGTPGSIACVTALVFVDCILSALLIKRILGLSFNGTFLFAYIIYCYLLFATPYFYILYTQDVGSHLSYFFLLLGVFLFYDTLNRSVVLCAGLLFVCCALAFLAKETYQLLALFFSFLWFLYYRKVSLQRALIPMAATIVAFIIAFANNMRVRSVFVSLKNPKDAPYAINLSPYSILREWAGYAKAGVNIADLLIIFIIGYLVLKYKGTERSRLFLFILIACFLAAGISWLPNAVLPNHHINGYSFNGLYLFYLPLFFLPLLYKDRILTIPVAGAIVALTLLSYWPNVSKYRSSANNWALQQEEIARNLTHSLDSLIGQLTPGPKPRKVLVEGITFFFHPFIYPESLREYPNAPLALYDVVYYTPDPRYEGRKDLVRFIIPSDTPLVHYDQKWIFTGDGRLAGFEGRSANRAGDSSGISIDLQDLPDYKTTGIYPPEGQDAIWVSDHVSIDLTTAIRGKDSLTVVLNTFMPPICRNVVPRVSMTDTTNKEYQPFLSERKNDVFYYHFAVNRKAFIKKVVISSQKIDSGPDQRVLSFLFKGLIIK